MYLKIKIILCKFDPNLIIMPIYLRTFKLFFVSLILCFSTISFSQQTESSPYIVPKNTFIVFDGQLNEAEWTQMETLPFVQFQPVYSKECTEELSVYLSYDQNYLYFSGRLYVSSPELIMQQSYKRDGEGGATDYFGLVIDSYNDKENALAFFTSPTGHRWDATISNDASGENFMSTSWNTYWDALTHVTEKYTDVEMRIPWSSLKFEAKNGLTTMGISSWRYMGAKYEMNLFPDISPDLGEMANWRPSLFREVQFENIKSSNPVYITPYLLLGNQRENILNDNETSFDYLKSVNYNAGLDVKFNVTSNLTLDATVNTDFAQVESDDIQINLTRYQLFRPEKRQFFQERSSLFDFSFNYVNRLFYSRNIGIDDGEAVPILGGARLTGKLGNLDVGIINMQTAKAGKTFGEGFLKGNISNNFSVIRLKKQVINPYSYIGGMVTNKMDFDGDFNTSYGLDGVFRILGSEYLTLKWAQTFEDGIESNPFSLQATRFMVGWEKRGFKGLTYNINSGSTGKYYNPEMGFMSRNNYIFTSATARYGIYLKDESFWRSLEFFANSWVDHNYEIEKIDQGSLSAGASLFSKNGWHVNLSYKHSYDFLTESLSFSDDVDIPEGDYSYGELGFRFFTPQNLKMGIGTYFEIGSYFDAKYFGFELESRYNPSSHFEVIAAYELKHLDFIEREQLLVSHILRLRGLYMLNTKFSVSVFLQYNNDSNLFISNLKLRYNPKEGNDLYLVFNEILNGDRDRWIPNYPLLNTEVLALKYTYTFKMD